MYDECKAQTNVALGSGLRGIDRPSPTLLQNIDNRIASLQDQISRLQKVKEVMQAESGILNVPLDDLRFAMNY